MTNRGATGKAGQNARPPAKRPRGQRAITDMMMGQGGRTAGGSSAAPSMEGSWDREYSQNVFVPLANPDVEPHEDEAPGVSEASFRRPTRNVSPREGPGAAASLLRGGGRDGPSAAAEAVVYDSEGEGGGPRTCEDASVRPESPSMSGGFSWQFMDGDALPLPEGYREVLRGKIVNEPIHGHYRLEPVCVAVMDTPEFQRLRYLKQLGTAYYVFPGACHNRFEHSLGVCHLANEWIQMFARNQPRLNITKEECQAVALAGLCHDLGHGPFSHVFENVLVPKLAAHAGNGKLKEFKHEAMSARLFRRIVRNNPWLSGDAKLGIKGEISDRVVDLVCDIITSGENGAPAEEAARIGRRFLFDIVANNTNSIDVDKFDYLERDAYHCGVNSGFDRRRLMTHAKVVGEEGEICFKSSEAFSVYQLFHTRYGLHKQIYQHRKAKAIEYMIADALWLADPVLRLSDILARAVDGGDEGLEGYISLDDTLLREIVRRHAAGQEGLEEAAKLVRRMERRDIYSFVNEAIVPATVVEECDRTNGWKNVTEEEIAACSRDGRLKAADLIVHNVKIDFCKKCKNPVDHVRFFQGFDSTVSDVIDSAKVTSAVPTNFMERGVRVFAKELHNFDAVNEAFLAWAQRDRRMRARESSQPASPIHGTPQKSQATGYRRASTWQNSSRANSQHMPGSPTRLTGTQSHADDDDVLLTPQSALHEVDRVVGARGLGKPLPQSAKTLDFC